jgi:predicted ester cyclase
MLLKVLVYAYTRYEITPQDVIAEDDKVVVRATLRATHEGKLIGIPRTSVQVAVLFER